MRLSWAVLGGSWAVWGPSWAVLETQWTILAALVACLGPFGSLGILDASDTLKEASGCPGCGVGEVDRIRTFFWGGRACASSSASGIRIRRVRAGGV